MRLNNNIKSLFAESNVNVRVQYDDRIMSGAFAAIEESGKRKSAALQLNAWRIIMRSKITKLSTAAAVILITIFAITVLDRSASPAYGIREALNLYKNSDTVHIHGWGYLPTKSKDKQEFVKVPFEHWFDVEKGCYRITKPGDIDENTGEPRYFTTISDGLYIMSEVYKYPLDGEPYKAVRFKKLTEFQSRLQAYNNSYSLIMQMFGGINTIKSFTKVGNETIKGINCDIWQGQIKTPSPQGTTQAKIKGWICPDTGELLKVQTWRKASDADSWSPMFEIDMIELDVELPQGLFETKPPSDCQVENTKEDAPLAELGGSSVGAGDLFLKVDVGFTLIDNSVILCWRSMGKNQALQDRLFGGLSVGGRLPKLPMEIYAIKPIANIDVEYPGYHLARTFRNNKFYEWSIYVPQNQVPSRESIIGYQLLHRYNTDKNKIVGSVSLSHHEDIQIETEEDFEEWVLGAMAELSDDGKTPEGITYQSVLELSRQIRGSFTK